ncbi:TasA family protein [Cellulomonas sp.]|uniref:TasA family protein n=1 Tax=Cellulomonas sp. TaxID=40001 RepID=UPI002D3E50B1|nr:TasA family protein [Cellulomonas sp.]HYQ76997.1 TasA family protein [Cellulomonas sp.]
MTTTPPADARRPADRRRGITARGRVLAAAGVVLATAVAGSFALFTDSGQVEASFTSGSVDLKFDGGVDGAPQAYPVTFSDAQDMSPGVTARYELDVYNSGSVPATLAMTTTAANADPAATAPLEQVLQLTVRDAAAPATALYTGPLADATLAGIDLGSGGSQTSGAVRLVFEATLPTGASVDAAGQAIDVEFTFTATQTP